LVIRKIITATGRARRKQPTTATIQILNKEKTGNKKKEDE
jgi:hypothetical protein